MIKRDFSDLVRRPNVRVSLTLPLALLDAIDAEAERIGVARSALVEYWLTQQIAGLGPAHPTHARPDTRDPRAK